MKKFFKIILIFFIIFSSYIFGFSLGKNKEKSEIYKELDIFAEALSIVNKKYPEEKPAKDLIYGAISGLISSLDPYSEFLTPQAYKELIIDTEGEFGGIGIEITIKDGLLTVVSPIEDTPAWKANIKPNDIIVKIDNETTKGITLNEAVKKLRGEPKTKVSITILRNDNKKIEDITLERDIIKIKNIKRSLILDDGIGYIRITEFREKTSDELIEALENLKRNNLKALIIDVRNNPGGLLDSAIKAANIFLEEGKPIVSIKSKDEKEYIYKSYNEKNKYLNISTVILVNKGSASASEIFASALRDNNKAILLGENTFGKGSVQSVIPLKDNSAIRLTTAKYYTAGGLSIDEKGITPDILIPKEESEAKEDIFEMLEKEDKFDYKKDNQIIRAVDLLKGLLILNK